MSVPEIQETVGGYRLEWKDEKLAITATRIHVHKDGRVTGEITIRTSADGYSPLLYPQSQINFSAPRTRREIANNLKEKYPDWQWDTIIDQLCYHVQHISRIGEPFHELWVDVETEVEPPEYLLKPLLQKGLPTVIFGEKGVNKSVLSLLFYACLMLPWHDNPFGLEVACDRESVKTVILDWEQDRDIVQYYLHRLCRGLGLPSVKLNYRYCRLPLNDDIEAINDYVVENGIQAVIIDSIGAAAGGELNKPEPALNFFSALRKLKVASLCIAQTSKDPESKKKTIYGSTYFTYYARSIWELCKADSTNEDENDLALFHRWANYSKLYKPMGFHLAFTDSAVRVEPQSVSLADFREKFSVMAGILDELKSGSHSVVELASALEASEGTIRNALSRLKAKGKIISLERGKWGLKS